MTGTEALEKLFQSIKSDFHYEEVPDEYCDYFEKIDKELKALEKLTKLIFYNDNTILSEKGNHYLLCVSGVYLSKELYNLLKCEVLENDRT